MQDRDRPRPPASVPPGSVPPGSVPPGSVPPDSASPDPAALARDWVTLWQSEIAAAAADREVQETWQTLASLWAGAAGTLLAALPSGLAGGRGEPKSGAAAAPGAAPAAAAPDARDAEIARLAERVADLERRLAGLERGGG